VLSSVRAHAAALNELVSLFPPELASKLHGAALLAEEIALFAELDAETREAVEAYERRHGVTL
jgi:hypothetical protein